MIRVKRGNIAAKRRKKYLILAKGYVGANSRLSTFAGEQVIQGLNFAYISRRLKKRRYKSIFISRINSVIRIFNINYSFFIGLLKKYNIYLDRKIIASIVFNDFPLFNILKKI